MTEEEKHEKILQAIVDAVNVKFKTLTTIEVVNVFESIDKVDELIEVLPRLYKGNREALVDVLRARKYIKE